MQQATTLEAVLTRDRTIVLGGLAALTVLAWGYTIYLASDMMGIGMGAATITIGSDGVAMPQLQPWGTVDFVLMFAMWAVMMTAMMLPSGAPMILVFAKINRKRRDQQKPFIPTSVFLGGYLIVWGGFALAATLAQWGLHAATLISPMMVGTSPILGGTLLLAAGVFQWSRIKYVCVTQCRSPLSFLMSEWREGTGGALKMGLRHGAYCLGCCWIIMSLLFVLGVMNLLWIAALAGFVLIEKVVRPGTWGNLVSWSTGLLLVAWGAWTILADVV